MYNALFGLWYMISHYHCISIFTISFQVFDAISYHKGSTVIRMVAAVLGPEKFRQGLQVYLKRHQYGNTTTRDLWSAWSEVSGLDVSSLMTSWTQQMGFPFLKVVEESWSADSVTITLEQGWFLADGSGGTGEGADKLWSIPLFFATSSSVSTEAVIMSNKRQTFTLPTSAGDWLKINAGQKALVRVAHSSTMISRLQPAISSNALAAEDRAALLLDTYALMKAGSDAVPPEAIVELLKAYHSEENYSVWTAIAGILSGLKLLMENLGGAANDGYLAFASSIVKKAFLKVGWAPSDASQPEEHTKKLLRSTVLGLVESFCCYDVDVVAEARRRFDAHWDNPAELPAEFKVSSVSPLMNA